MKSIKNIKTLPFWAPVVVFLILHLGSQISLLARHDLAVSDFYLTTALSVVMVYWIGPKIVIPAVFINSVSTSLQWGTPVEKWPLWFLYAIPETLFAFLSWALFIKLYNGKYWFPDIRNTILFLVMGVFVPAVIEVFLLQSMLLWTDSILPEAFWSYISSNLLGEFATTFFLTMPLLYYVTPWLVRKGKLRDPHQEIREINLPETKVIFEMGAIYCALLALVFVLGFREFWFIYGFFPLYAAIRYGFGPAILTNFYILVIIYVVPKVFKTFGENEVGDYKDVIQIFLGSSLLFVFAAITGRVISDVRIAEGKLMKQNEELLKMNEELDRFVYSVSHDLSAPLKSIRGLVNISRLTTDPHEHEDYLSRIDKSVNKLEAFIVEIMDYSRNKREQLVKENIPLKELIDEIIDNLQDTPMAELSRFEFLLLEREINQDKSRLKIILNNLLSNAIKFQKQYTDHQPLISISSFRQNNEVLIEIKDNGEGIRSEQLESIFKMFYRGHERLGGSGLGLYIAKEAAAKINADITVKSEYGIGTTFQLILKI